MSGTLRRQAPLFESLFRQQVANQTDNCTDKRGNRCLEVAKQFNTELIWALQEFVWMK